MKDVIDGNLAVVRFGAAYRHDPAAAGETPDRLVEKIPADVLDHEIDAALLRASQDLIDEIDSVVIDHLVCPEFLCPLELPVCARCGVNVGPGELADLNGRHAYAGACGIDQYRFACAQRAAINQHVPSRPEGIGKSRRLLESHAVRQCNQMISRQLDVLRIGAVLVRAEITVVPGTTVVVARHALLAAATRQDPPARHARPYWQIGAGVRAQCNQFTAKIAAQNVGKFSLVWLVASGSCHKVIAVEPDRMHLDQRFAALRARYGKISKSQNAGIAILLENDSLHPVRDQCDLQK